MLQLLRPSLRTVRPHPHPVTLGHCRPRCFPWSQSQTRPSLSILRVVVDGFFLLLLLLVLFVPSNRPLPLAGSYTNTIHFVVGAHRSSCVATAWRNPHLWNHRAAAAAPSSPPVRSLRPSLFVMTPSIPVVLRRTSPRASARSSTAVRAVTTSASDANDKKTNDDNVDGGGAPQTTSSPRRRRKSPSTTTTTQTSKKKNDATIPTKADDDENTLCDDATTQKPQATTATTTTTKQRRSPKAPSHQVLTDRDPKLWTNEMAVAKGSHSTYSLRPMLPGKVC